MVQLNTQYIRQACIPPIESEKVHSIDWGCEETCNKGQNQWEGWVVWARLMRVHAPFLNRAGPNANLGWSQVYYGTLKKAWVWVSQ